MKSVIFSEALGSAFTVSVRGILYASQLKGEGYNSQKWAKVCAVNETNVAELESVVTRLVNNSQTEFEFSKTDVINNILFNQVTVINY
jgi:hypothetical protein